MSRLLSNIAAAARSLLALRRGQPYEDSSSESDNEDAAISESRLSTSSLLAQGQNDVAIPQLSRQLTTFTLQLQKHANQEILDSLLESTPLPPELAVIILDLAGVWLDTTVSSGANVAVSQRSEILIRTAPLSTADVVNLRQITFAFSSKDQGWSDYRNDWGTFRNSWTWFEAHVQCPAVVENEPGPRLVFELQRNRHAAPDHENYELTFHEDNEILDALRRGGDGTYVELIALASFPGWVNNVRRAAVTISLADCLTNEDDDEGVGKHDLSLL